MQSLRRAHFNPDGNSAAARLQLFLLYHEVREGVSDYSYVMRADLFEQQASLFAKLKTDPQSLFPELTFDDGHSSNLEVAAPILDQHGLSARFFITAGWTGKRPGFMNWQQLRTLAAAGHTIGAHGWSHKLLTHCSSAELNRELSKARLTLEDGVGIPVTTMSLPGGRANERVLTACREAGYTQIFTSEPKAETLPLGETVGRFNIRGDMQTQWLAELLQPGSGLLQSIERRHRLKSIAKSLLGDALYARLWELTNHREADAADAWETAD